MALAYANEDKNNYFFVRLKWIIVNRPQRLKITQKEGKIKLKQTGITKFNCRTCHWLIYAEWYLINLKVTKYAHILNFKAS
jgi:hypothetical protein